MRWRPTTYDLDSIDVLASPAYQAIAHENLSPWSKRMARICDRLMRFEGQQIAAADQAAPTLAGGLLINAMSVAPEHEAAFNDWYDSEHIPALAAVPGTLAARRFRSMTGTPRYLAIYDLASPDVQGTEEWKRAANTPWTQKMRPHFRDHVRIVARAYSRP